MLGDYFGGHARQISARQAHKSFGFGTGCGDGQASVARKVHHRGVLDKTVHEQDALTRVAGTRHTTFKQSGADPPGLGLVA